MATINTDIAQKIDIVTRENNSATINLVIADSSGAAFNLTGYTVNFKVYSDNIDHIAKSNGSGITATGSGSGTLDSTGKITIKLTTTDLSILPGSYSHKLTLTKGDDVKTWMYGKFKVNND